MVEPDDGELLRAFSDEGSQGAFATLARRHAGLLYHAALRQTGRPDLAEEAAQNALAILARKASSLRPGPSLAGWLHRTVCFEASKLGRRERRHDDRMKHLHDPALAPAPPMTPDGWEMITPHLDEALNDLSDPDRQVVLLKYFAGWSFEEMAGRLGGQSGAWRQRGSRALERLRRRLARRGAEVPVAVLAAGLGSTLSQAAPSAVVASLTTVPLATAASLSWKILALHTLHTMNAKQVSIAVALIVTTLVPLGFQAAAVHRSQARVAALETKAAALRSVAGLSMAEAAARPRPGLATSGAGYAKVVASAGHGIDLREMARVLAQGSHADVLRMMDFRSRLNRLDARTLDGLLSTAEALDLPPAHRRVLYEQLLSTLRVKDPFLATATGMRLVAAMSGDDATQFWMNPLPNCLREWAQKDPAAARAWFDEQSKAEAFQDRGLGDADLAGWMAAGLFTGMMWGGDRQGGLAFFETLDEAARSAALRRFGTSNIGAGDHAEILKLAEGLSQPEARTNALMGVAVTLGRSDLTQAGSFITQAGLPSAEARKLLLAAAVAPLNDSPVLDVTGRLSWLRAQTPAGQQEKAVGYFLGDTAFTDPGGITQRVDAEIAAGASDTFLGAFIRNTAHHPSTMEAALGYLPRLTDPAERTRTLREIQQSQPEAGRAAALRAGLSAAELDAALQAR